MLVVPSPLLDLGHQVLYAGAEVDHEVRLMDHFHHDVVRVHIRVVITLREVSLRVIVGNKNMDALKEGAVLDDYVLGLSDFHHVMETLLKEIHFQGKGPALYVLVVVFKIGIVGY